MALATAPTGLLLCVLGFTRAGRAIRFVPYPVIGGFLGATGWVMVIGAIQVVTDHQPTLANLDAFATRPSPPSSPPVSRSPSSCSPAAALAQSPFVLPGVLLAAFVAMHLGLAASDMTIAAGAGRGWMFHPHGPAPLTCRGSPKCRRFPWHCASFAGGDVLAVMFVTISSCCSTPPESRSRPGARPISSAISRCTACQSVDRRRSAAWWSARRSAARSWSAPRAPPADYPG